MFLAYANEKSATHACLLIRILLTHLKVCGVQTEGMKIQIDNGSEFIGCTRQDKTRDGFGPAEVRSTMASLMFPALVMN